MNLTIRSAPWPIEPAQHRERNTNKDSVKNLNVFPYLEHVQNIADLEFQPLPTSLMQTQTYPGTGPPLSDYIAELW